jgi:hypothetical protein
MPDPLLFLEALAAAAVTAAAALLLAGWPWRAPRAARAAAGGVLGVGLGLFVGCWWLGVRPHWPPREDQDRLLLILFPAALAVELAALIPGRLARAAWLLRLTLAAGAAPLLLYNSSYLADLAGPGTREWTPARAALILGGLAAVLAGVWAALTLLAQRGGGRAVPLALALVCAGAAVTVMLSGYASGGQLGLPLAAALVGTLAASPVLAKAPDVRGITGLAVVGLFALVVIGRFFGELATGGAVVLFLGPLLCWLPELPLLRRLGPRLRGSARVALVAVPVVVAVALAQQRHTADASRSAPGPAEPTLQDYLDFGK